MQPSLKTDPAFCQVIDRVKTLRIEEKRTDLPVFFECVIGKDSLGPLTALLGHYFGPPAKPAGEKPTHAMEKYTAPYGGILNNQILYLVEKEGGSTVFLAMIWPWMDGARVTVKLVEHEA